MKVKNEQLFLEFYTPGVLNSGPSVWEANDTGRKQFIEHQSYGRSPENPDPYFLVLEAGKRAFDLMSKELYDSYTSINPLSLSWDGFFLLWHDYKGKRWVLPHLLGWFKKETGCNLPRWLGEEQEPEFWDGDYDAWDIPISIKQPMMNG